MSRAFVKLSRSTESLRSNIKSCKTERPVKFKALPFEYFKSLDMVFQNESQKCVDKGLGTSKQAKSDFFCSLQDKTIHNGCGPEFVITV